MRLVPWSSFTLKGVSLLKRDLLFDVWCLVDTGTTLWFAMVSVLLKSVDLTRESKSLGKTLDWRLVYFSRDFSFTRR